MKSRKEQEELGKRIVAYYKSTGDKSLTVKHFIKTGEIARRSVVYKILKRYHERGSVSFKPRPGRRRTSGSAKNLQRIKELYEKEPFISVREAAKRLGTNHGTIQRYKKQALGIQYPSRQEFNPSSTLDDILEDKLRLQQSEVIDVDPIPLVPEGGQHEDFLSFFPIDPGPSSPFSDLGTASFPPITPATHNTSSSLIKDEVNNLKCFVCLLPSQTNLSKEPSATDYSTLLGDILELSNDTLEGYKNQFGAFEKWINLCKPCLELVIEGRHIKEQILALEKQFSKRKALALKKFKENVKEGINQQGQQRVRKGRKRKTETVEKTVQEIVYARICDNNMEMKKIIKTENTLEEDTEESYFNEDYFLENDDRLSPSYSGEASEPVTAKTEQQSHVLYCGLCEDLAEFSSVQLLSSHQNEVHGSEVIPTPPFKTERDTSGYDEESNIPKRKKTSSEIQPGQAQRKVPGRKAKQIDQDYIENNKKVAAEQKRDVYSCSNCPEVKDYSLNRFAQHLIIHWRRPFKCQECFEFLPDNDDSLEQHWNERHNDKERHADDKFLKIELNPVKIWKCEGCIEGFCTEEDRYSHEKKCKSMKGNKTKKLQPAMTCEICSKSFRNKNEWRLHRVLLHPEEDTISCLLCDESFPGPVLDWEGKQVRDDTKMLEHFRLKHKPTWQKEGKTYDQCEACGIIFTRSDDSDYKSHAREKHGLPELEVYPCRICQNGFSYPFSVRNHTKTVHFYPTVRKKIPKSKDSLRKPCHYCGKSIKSSHYSRHLQIHENQDTKPFQCDLCGSSFAVKNYLYIHKRMTHEKRTFPSTNKKRFSTFKD